MPTFNANHNQTPCTRKKLYNIAVTVIALKEIDF